MVEHNKGKKVFVGLSGGVDSAVSAALLKDAGYDVIGVFIRIAIPGYPCTAGADKVDAMRVAAHLKIPFNEIDLSDEYKKRIFDHSIKEFQKGNTPNPDVLCNREIKFGLFYDYATAQGADLVATGHYAQIQNGMLYAGADADPLRQSPSEASKDQSYFLALVPQNVFARVLFPIGHLHKNAVRKLAKKFGLPNAERPDSQGLCFLGPVSVGDLLQQELSTTAGDVLDEHGAVVGRQRGAALYTLGQRHGFTVQSSVPLYVIGKDIEANTITVSKNKFPTGASRTEVELSDCNWIGTVRKSYPYSARYRYRQALIPAELCGNLASVILHQPHYVPNGQVLALYEGGRCIGGGVVGKTRLY